MPWAALYGRPSPCSSDGAFSRRNDEFSPSGAINFLKCVFQSNVNFFIVTQRETKINFDLIVYNNNELFNWYGLFAKSDSA